MNFNQLSIYTYVVTGVCLLAVFLLAVLVLYLLVRLNRLEKVPTPQKHCFLNKDILPEEELSKRGYTMYQGRTETPLNAGDSMKTSNTSLNSGRTLHNPQANWRSSGNIP